MRIRALTILIVSLHATPAAALSFSGQVSQIAPPPNAEQGQLESNDFAFFWVEREGAVLASPLAVDVIPFLNNPSGFYDSGVASVEATWGGLLGAGVYDSFFLHADKDGVNATFAGSITFERPIEGIIYKQPELVDSDPLLGAIGTTYGAGGSGRIYELDGDVNYFILSADRLTLTFQTEVAHNMDDMRIVTQAPEPAALWLLAIGLGVAAARRRMQGA